MELTSLNRLEVQGNLYPDEILIVPAGSTQTDKGVIVIDEKSAKKVISLFKKRKNHIPVDFGHSTVDEPGNSPAVAAGWITSLRYDEKKGLIGSVEWVEGTQALIESKQIKYLSPTVWQTEDGTVTDIHSIALTNVPAIHGQKELLAASRGNSMTKDFVERMQQVLNDDSVTKDNMEDRIVNFIEELQATKQQYSREASELKDSLAVSREKVAELEASLPEPFEPDMEMVEEWASMLTQKMSDRLTCRLTKPVVEDLSKALLGTEKMRNAMVLFSKRMPDAEGTFNRWQSMANDVVDSLCRAPVLSILSGREVGPQNLVIMADPSADNKNKRTEAYELLSK